MALGMAIVALKTGQSWSFATTGGFIFSGMLVHVSPSAVEISGASIRKLNYESDLRGPNMTIAVDQIVAFWEG